MLGPVYTLANRLTCDESEVLAARAALDAEKKANAAAIAKYRARQVCGGVAWSSASERGREDREGGGRGPDGCCVWCL